MAVSNDGMNGVGGRGRGKGGRTECGQRWGFIDSRPPAFKDLVGQGTRDSLRCYPVRLRSTRLYLHME